MEKVTVRVLSGLVEDWANTDGRALVNKGNNSE